MPQILSAHAVTSAGDSSQADATAANTVPVTVAAAVVATRSTPHDGTSNTPVTSMQQQKQPSAEHESAGAGSIGKSSYSTFDDDLSCLVLCYHSGTMLYLFHFQL